MAFKVFLIFDKKFRNLVSNFYKISFYENNQQNKIKTYGIAIFSDSNKETICFFDEPTTFLKAGIVLFFIFRFLKTIRTKCQTDFFKFIENCVGRRSIPGSFCPNPDASWIPWPTRSSQTRLKSSATIHWSFSSTMFLVKVRKTFLAMFAILVILAVFTILATSN